MKARFVLLFVAASAYGQVNGNDTEIPNQFQFSSARFFASKGTTNAVVTVDFYPGNSSFSGSVNYATQDGTAIANQDYTPTSGTLVFDGTYPRPVINVPVLAAPGEARTNLTVQLVLTPSPNDPGANITRASALLFINLPPPPKLTIAPQTNGTVLVSWPDDGTNPLLEKNSSPFGANWSGLYNVYSDGKGILYCADIPSGGMAFYRLRRLQ